MAFNLIFYCHKDNFWPNKCKTVILSDISNFQFCSFLNLNENNVFLTWFATNMSEYYKIDIKIIVSIVLLYGKHLKGVKHILILTPVVTVWHHFFLTCTYMDGVIDQGTHTVFLSVGYFSPTNLSTTRQCVRTNFVHIVPSVILSFQNLKNVF